MFWNTAGTITINVSPHLKFDVRNRSFGLQMGQINVARITVGSIEIMPLERKMMRSDICLSDE